MDTETAKRFRSSAAWKAARRIVLAEEDLCGICSKPVDKTMQRGLPGSPEVDHIIPLERGGSPLDRSNHMLTHKRCNQLKSNKVLTRAELARMGDTITAERYRGPSEDWSSIFGG